MLSCLVIYENEDARTADSFSLYSYGISMRASLE